MAAWVPFHEPEWQTTVTYKRMYLTVLIQG